MSGLEVNKILASIILTLIVVKVIGHIGDFLIDVNDTEMLQTAYKIEVPETFNNVSGSDSEEEVIEPISLILANGSFDKGQKIFKKCSACHTYKKEGANKVGPNLWNLINSPKANVEGFAYSKELAEFGGQWSYEELSQFFQLQKNDLFFPLQQVL